MTPTNPEHTAESSAAQAVRIKRNALFALAVALLILVLLEHGESYVAAWMSFVPQVIREICYGVIVVALAARYSETGFFRNYLEERIEAKTRELVKEDFVSRAQSLTFLQQIAAKERTDIIVSLQRSFFGAAAPADIKTLFASLSQITENLTVWRKEYLVVLTVKDATDGLAPLNAKYGWRYVNFSGNPHEASQQIMKTVRVKPGSQPAGAPEMEETLKPLWFSVDGVDHLNDLKWNEHPLGSHESPEQIRHLGTYPMTIPPCSSESSVHEGMKVEYVMETMERVDIGYMQRFYYPVHGFTLIVHHPLGWKPSLRIFGVGGTTDEEDPAEPVDASEHSRQWSYDGWLLPNHGFILDFGLFRASGTM